MLMAPSEVLLLFTPPHSVKITVVAMPFSEIRAVCPILAVVPRMVVVALPIVVASFVIPVVSSRYGRTDQGSAQNQRAQNKEPMHVVSSARGTGTLLAVRQENLA